MFELLAQETTTQANPLTPLLLFGVMGVGLYFVMIRPQKRRMQAQRELLNQLEVGDEVVTAGGIFGTIVDIDDDEDVITVTIAPGTDVRMLRGGISRRLVDEDDEEIDVDEDDENEADRSS
jgi:preprotein translocase subunit YajC